MNSLLFAKTTIYGGITSRPTRFDRYAVKFITNFETRFHPRCYSTSTGVSKSRVKKSNSKPAPPVTALMMEEEKNSFFVVLKGDLVGVYKTLIDCQAQVGSSVLVLPTSLFFPNSIICIQLSNIAIAIVSM